MEGRLPRIFFDLHPLIAEAKWRMPRRRLLVVCAAVIVATSAVGISFALRSPVSPAIEPAGLAALVGTWSHHGAELVIRPSGWGVMKARTYSEKPPGELEVTFKVIRATRTGRTVNARIRVLHGSSAADTPARTPGIVRLWRGVIYWSTANFRRAVTFCSVKPGAQWICGL